MKTTNDTHSAGVQSDHRPAILSAMAQLGSPTHGIAHVLVVSIWIALAVGVELDRAYCTEAKRTVNSIEIRPSKPDHIASKLSCDRLFAGPAEKQNVKAPGPTGAAAQPFADALEDLPPQLKGSFHVLEQLRLKHERLASKDAFEMTQEEVDSEIRRLQNPAKSSGVTNYSSRNSANLALSESVAKRLETLKGAKELLNQCSGDLFDRGQRPQSEQNDDL